MKLSEVINKIKPWIRTIQVKHNEELKIEFLVEREDFLRYILESNNFLAEIIVEPKGFHPHRFVSFTALDKAKAPMLQEGYYYYDDEDSSLRNIFENLNNAILYILK